MLHNRCSVAARLCSRRAFPRAAKLSTSLPASFHGPNAPLDLDPSLQDLLRDADMALLKHKPRENGPTGPHAIRELEILEFDETLEERDIDDETDVTAPKERKSVRAKFGSRSIGSVFLPVELRDAIERIIHEGDKPRLHEDAKRLFREERRDGSEVWNTTYDAEYKSREQAARHADRDGTAFASIALPAHYSAIYAVLDNLKHRLGEEYQVQHVVEWGSGVGSGLWASMHAFQDSPGDHAQGRSAELLLSQSTVCSYLGIDKRVGISSMAKKLVKDVDIGNVEVKWAKGFSETEQVQRSEGGDTLALSAFHLSSLPTHIARKEMVKQMWNSGANVIVLIDHDTSAGFEIIAEAREQLLRLGRKEVEDPAVHDGTNAGCHVVAPCPHDGACPLYQPGSSKLRCTFSQRLQRPVFLRKTKHAHAGHEDIGYSYVVIKRGKRPTQMAATTEGSGQEIAVDVDNVHQIRLEAYNWPRMIFSPLKKSGHVIIDGCTAEGRIMRMTIPRSQGKQPYYDARKSSWGDIFPHKPKNPPQVRLQSSDKKNSDPSTPGADIGKRRSGHQSKQALSYGKILSDIKENKKNMRRGRTKEADSSED
ncbi:hypothetical protein M0805_000948 [Coniferiporia weirii]|nr:hypothetical protein M0805_000948 [Coniferiporia weirii]